MSQHFGNGGRYKLCKGSGIFIKDLDHSSVRVIGKKGLGTAGD